MNIDKAPGFWKSFLTLQIAMGLWVSHTNAAIGKGGAGFLFAWFLAPFAYYGLAKRLNEVLAAQGSRTKASPMACFWLVGWPFIGSRKRLGRAADAVVR